MSRPPLLLAADLPARAEIYGGIRESEAAALLRDFFQGKR